MTFTEISTEICELVGLSSTTDVARVGRAINRKYREITASLGIKHTSRRATVQATMTIGISTLAFTSAEKVVNVFNRNVTPYKQLEEVTIDELEATMPFAASDTPTLYAIKQVAADSVTILVNCVPQTAFALYADVYSTAATLSGTDKPVFSESYHDILISAVMIDEYLKLEKLSLSRTAEVHVEKRMGELRHWFAVSTTKQMYQGKQKESGFGGSGISGGSGGGSSANGALSYTQSGLITFDRSSAVPDVPFAVAAGADKVANLDADKLDGLDSTAFALAGATPTLHATTHKSGGTDAIKLDELAAPTDVVTLNASSTKHGLAPKSPADAMMFLNGAATPAYAAVKDSDLATTDVATNNAATTKHGFLKKLSNIATEFMNGAGNWAVPASSPDTEVTTTSTGAQNDFAPGLVGNTILRCNNASDLTISGFTGGVAGQRLTIVSIGAGNVYFVHQATSTAANQLINNATSGNTPLAAGVGSAVYEYDGTTLRWRLLAHQQGATIAYTPTWTAAGGSPAIGNGTLTGKYFLRGRSCWVDVHWVAGGTTNFGTGVYKFTVPFTGVATDGAALLSALGTCAIFDNGTNYRSGFAEMILTTALCGVIDSAADNVGATIPITFVSGDELRLTIDIQVT